MAKDFPGRRKKKFLNYRLKVHMMKKIRRVREKKKKVISTGEGNARLPVFSPS